VSNLSGKFALRFNPMTAKKMEESALKAIKSLRKQKLSQGLPFMINSDKLDSSQCFLEYPDGTIRIVEANKKEGDFYVLFELSKKDANSLRRKLKLG
jgi:hypothetical protein